MHTFHARKTSIEIIYLLSQYIYLQPFRDGRKWEVPFQLPSHFTIPLLRPFRGMRIQRVYEEYDNILCRSETVLSQSPERFTYDNDRVPSRVHYPLSPATPVRGSKCTL